MAVLETPGDDALPHCDGIRCALSTAAKEMLEMLLQDYELQDEGLRRALKKGERLGRAACKAEGEAEGKAEDVLAVLEARGLAVTATQRAAVLSTKDVAPLDAWLRGAVTAASTAVLLSSRSRAEGRLSGSASRGRTVPARRRR